MNVLSFGLIYLELLFFLKTRVIKMNKATNISAVVTMAFLLPACASMNKEDCVSADWQSVGYEDGSKGLNTEEFSDRKKQCAKHGITVSEDLYSKGYDEGLSQYCTPKGGLLAGESGKKYQNVCSTELEAAFLPIYEKGLKYHRVQWLAESARESYYDLIEKIDKNTTKIDDMKDELPSITDKDKYNKKVKKINKLVKKNNSNRRNVSVYRQSADDAERQYKEFNTVYKPWRIGFLKKYSSTE